MGQRHFAYPREYLLEHAVVLEFERARALLALRDNLAAQPRRESKARTDFGALCGTTQRFPGMRVDALTQQERNIRARSVLYAVYHGGQHARVVYHEHVVRAQKLGQIVKMLMRNRVRLTVVNQKPRRVARLYRRLRD